MVTAHAVYAITLNGTSLDQFPDSAGCLVGLPGFSPCNGINFLVGILSVNGGQAIVVRTHRRPCYADWS